MHPQRAIIIGAGPAGLTAGLELLRRTGIQPIILEASQEIGGISRTVRHHGNRMDIGGHRFFSKSDRVMQWWLELMPIAQDRVTPDTSDETISYRGQHRRISTDQSRPTVPAHASGARAVTRSGSGGIAALEELPESIDHAEHDDLVMLIRSRKSRIYFLRKFFDYPITLTRGTLANLGAVRTARVAASYVLAQLHPRREEKTLEDFLINRFGRELYLTFFKSYTEKVWGTPCNEISAEWGAQRIKGLSLTKAVSHFLKKTFARKDSADAPDISQKRTDTSLIERFMYPKLGPGQLWEHVADLIQSGVRGPHGKRSGELHLGWRVVSIHLSENRVEAVTAVNARGQEKTFMGDYFCSTMPVRELIQSFDSPVPDNVREVSDGLQYRDFITIGLLVDRLAVNEADGAPLKDTWIYIQEPDVQLGRLQIFNNWSPYLISDPSRIWIGLEYFCNESDELWKMNDAALTSFAIAEVEKIGLVDSAAVHDTHVVRVPKAYPGYFGTYDRLDEIRQFTDSIQNLFLVGRNGMHKYNNQDHSMLTAMAMVDGLAAGRVDKAALWSINTEQDYHEGK